MKQTYISSTANTGNGLFAKEHIYPYEHIFIIEGTIRKDEYTKEEASAPYPNDLNIAPGLWITPHDSNPWRYVNHSCQPNLGLKEDNGKFIVIALQDIAQDQELTINYSITEGNPYWKMDCHCQQPKCQKVIRSVRYLPKHLFQIYSPYLLSFLKSEWEQEQIKLIKSKLFLS